MQVTGHGVPKSQIQLSNFTFTFMEVLGFPGGSDGKESACNVGDLGSIPQATDWQLTPVFLPGEFQGFWWATVHAVTESNMTQ